MFVLNSYTLQKKIDNFGKLAVCNTTEEKCFYNTIFTDSALWAKSV